MTKRYKIVNCKALNIRSRPSIKAKVVLTLPVNSTVQVVVGYKQSITEKKYLFSKKKTITWYKIKSNEHYYFVASNYLIPWSRGDALAYSAKTRAEEMVADRGWYYKDAKHKVAKTYDAAKNGTKGCDCARFASYAMQDSGVVDFGEIISHTKAGYGTGFKSITNISAIKNATISYPNKLLSKILPTLTQGCVIVNDSSIGVFSLENGVPVIYTGRSGVTLDKSGKYIQMRVLSGYEFNNPVLAVIKPND